MSVITIFANSYVTPGDYGGDPIISGTTTGYPTNTLVVGDSIPDQQRSANWLNYPVIFYSILLINFKFTYSFITHISIFEVASFTIEYSLNSGGSWNTAVNHVAENGSGFNIVNQPISISIPASQNIAAFRVRNVIFLSSTGTPQSTENNITNLRLEATVIDITPAIVLI